MLTKVDISKTNFRVGPEVVQGGPDLVQGGPLLVQGEPLLVHSTVFSTDKIRDLFKVKLYAN